MKCLSNTGKTFPTLMGGKTVSTLGLQQVEQFVPPALRRDSEQFVPLLAKAGQIALTLVVTLALLTLASLAYADQPQQIIDVQHDSEHGATCWILNDHAISCLPDSSLKHTTTDTPSSEAARASPSGLVLKKGQLPTTPETRFQL